MKASEIDALLEAINIVYGDKPPKRIKKLIRRFDLRVNEKRKVLSLIRVTTESGVTIITDDRGYILDGVISMGVTSYDPSDIERVIIEVSHDSKSLKGLNHESK